MPTLSACVRFKTIYTLSYGDANDAANPSPRPVRHAILVESLPEGDVEFGILVEELEPMIHGLEATGKAVPPALREALESSR